LDHIEIKTKRALNIDFEHALGQVAGALDSRAGAALNE
jgi:hypothetical protein